MSPRRLLPVLFLVVALAVACGATARSDDTGGTTGVVVGDVSPETTPTTGPATTAPPTAIVREVDGHVQDGVEVRTNDVHGWLVDPDAHEGWMFEDGAELLFPTQDEAAQAEAILAEQLPVERDRETEYWRQQLDEVLADLGAYERQYAAALVDGDTLVYVNALCDPDVGGGDLGTTIIGVDDGGSCYWNALVDLDTATLVRVSVNGQA